MIFTFNSSATPFASPNQWNKFENFEQFQNFLKAALIEGRGIISCLDSSPTTIQISPLVTARGDVYQQGLDFY